MREQGGNSESDEGWMHEALILASTAAADGEVPVGAVIVRDNQIIGRGHNQQIRTNDPTAHAEIIALRDAGAKAGNYRLPSAEMYVTIEPCNMCAGALIHARIARLVFGATEPRAGAVISSARVLDNPALNHRVTVSAGILETECGDMLSAFFRSRR